MKTGQPDGSQAPTDPAIDHVSFDIGQFDACVFIYLLADTFKVVIRKIEFMMRSRAMHSRVVH
jgi:hypothetical protein